MKTPRYEFDKKTIKNNYKKLKENLGFCDIYYDIKANDHPLILNLLKKINSQFKCNSKYEFNKILDMGLDPNSVIFSAPIQTSEIISDIYNKGCRYFVFDDIRDLITLEKYAPNSKKILLVDFSDITFAINHYGMPYERICNETIKYNYSKRIDGLMYQIDHNNNIETLHRVMDRIKDIFKLLDYNNKEYILSIGDGFKANSTEEFYKLYREVLIDMKNNFNCRLTAEPGEAIVSSAGYFIVKVISLKIRKDLINVYVDGGYPNGFGFAPFYGTVNIVGEIKDIKNKQVYNFIDCTNLNKPMLTMSLNFELRVGDVLKFTNSGAYTLVYQNDFHMWDKCDVVMI